MLDIVPPSDKFIQDFKGNPNIFIEFLLYCSNAAVDIFGNCLNNPSPATGPIQIFARIVFYVDYEPIALAGRRRRRQSESSKGLASMDAEVCFYWFATCKMAPLVTCFKDQLQYTVRAARLILPVSYDSQQTRGTESLTRPPHTTSSSIAVYVWRRVHAYRDFGRRFPIGASGCARCYGDSRHGSGDCLIMHAPNVIARLHLHPADSYKVLGFMRNVCAGNLQICAWLSTLFNWQVKRQRNFTPIGTNSQVGINSQ